MIATRVPRRPGATWIEPTIVGVIVGAVTVAIGLPMLLVMVSSVLADPFDPPSGFSATSIAAVYTSAPILRSLFQTIVMAVVIALLATAIGGLFAWMTVRLRLPAARLLTAMAVMPLFMSPLVSVIAWIALAAPNSGMLNGLLQIAGMPHWLRLNIFSPAGIMFVLVLQFQPYGYLFLTGALRNIDTSFEEASYVAGAGVMETMRRIVLPLLRAPLLSSILFIAILAAGEFSVPSLLAGRSTFVPLSVRIYEAINGFPQDFGRAAAIGTMLIGLSLIAFYFYRRSIREQGRFVTLLGRGFNTRQIDPGAWKWPILALFGLYGIIAILLPYLALLFVTLAKFRTGSLAAASFGFHHLETVLTTPGVELAIVNTLIVAGVVPLACVLFAILLTYAQDRQRLPGSGIAVTVATIPIAVSGIVFASGVLVIYIRTPLYGTIWLIAVGLFAHYLTHALRITGNGLSQIDGSLEEAARLNGASLSTTLRTITAPLIAPSLWSAAVLIFTFCVREMNTAIILYSPSSPMLSVLSWTYANDGDLGSAATIGLLQIVVTAVILVAAKLLLGVSAAREAA